ncbi:MAG TPA: NUDIX hydrolase [Micromonosporaceae bacterium]|nr:NUDIX hydrolase [Micromonosporaceae bacterium]
MTQPPAEEVEAQAPIAAAVIVVGGRVLMVRRSVAEGELSWQFPGGEVEPGESAEDAAVREAREETGLTVKARQRLGDRVHPDTGRAMIYVACDLVDGAAYSGDPDDLVEVEWCDRATLTTYVRQPLSGPVQEYFDATLF